MAEPNLQKGSTDPAVGDLQEALKALGYNPGPIDGVFGAATEAAVKAFQQARGITADGIVGKVTWINGRTQFQHRLALISLIRYTHIRAQLTYRRLTDD
jgi:peptidoglycan hydrolase-like protein with peptidoglycan-binding domain